MSKKVTLAKKIPDAKLFLELAKPDKYGFSRVVKREEFVGKYKPLDTPNGSHWSRKESSLANKYNIRKIQEGNKVVSYELHGFKKVPVKKPVPKKIKDKIKVQNCKVLAISRVETDHKDGRLDDPRLSDPKKVTIDDFQPLSKGANNAKRQHCKECRNTDKRFDARRLGYSIGQVRGNGKYEGTCVGCYWHDPFFFNEEVSKGAK